MRKATKTANNILPADTKNAIRALITISKKLCTFADQETQALVMGDMMRFAYTQQDKEKLTHEYASASEEFRMRIEEFRTVDKALLKELDLIQVDLKKKSEGNNLLIRQIRDRALTNTKGTLFAAQELGQRVSFASKKPVQAQQGA